tara:strand:+ start:3986 stop:8035 length:4050 start_codon:yes stop_codon:yes gene_type:complete
MFGTTSDGRSVVRAIIDAHPHVFKNRTDIPKDALASKQFQTLIDLISEGVISGFPSATGSQGSDEYTTSSLKDVFLNDTQVLQQNAGTSPSDEDFNYKNITFVPRFGTSDQTAIKGISSSEAEQAVGVAVEKDTPVSRSISDSNVDAVRVTIAFPQLQRFETNGDINGAEVSLSIQTIENDGTTKTVITDTVKGRAASTYFRDYKINLPSGTSFPVTIRVNRVTDDSTDSNLVDAFQWSSFTEIIEQTNTFANSAVVALRFDAESFPRIPTRKYRVRGTLIKIPHNGTVRSDGSISYSGTFNGSLKSTKEYSNDPAWVLYDLLTTSKGLGDHIDTSQLDVFSFYSASVYCSEQVDDMTGTGNTEARFSTNVVLNSQRQAYDLINSLSSVMRVMPFYTAGSISITQDRPTDPSYIYNLSNVTEEGFTYSNPSKSTKATVVNVSYFDNDTQQVDYETVEDTALQAKYGVVVKNLRGFATTSRGQAARLGKWFLYTQSNEAEICTFKTSIESGSIVRVGTVINIQDPLKAGVRRGGRVKRATTKRITVDDANSTDLTASNSATLSVVLPDGTIETKSIATAGITSGTYTQSGGTTISINLNNHDFNVGDVVTLNFTSGGTASPDGLYTIATEDGDDNFTVTSTVSDSASGNVNVTLAGSESGTYSQSSTTITVTLNNHGLNVGESVDLNFTSGGTSSANGKYTVVSEDGDDTFTVTSASSDSASGNVIVTIGSGGNVVTVTEAFSQTPNVNTVWVIENSSLSLQTFKIFSVKEVNLTEYEIQAVAHNPSKYSFVEDGSTLATKTITTLTQIKPPPSNLQATEQIVVINNRAVSKLFIQWQAIQGVTEYQIQYRFNEENFITQRIERSDFTIFETDIGTYEIRVFSYNALGQPSRQPSTVTVNTVGKTALPADVQNLVLEPVNDQFVRLRFTQSTDVDVLHGGNVVVRHSNLTDGTGTFTNSVDLIPALAGNVSETLIPAIDGEVILKFRDDGGRLSAGETSVIISSPDAFPKLTVLNDREDTDSPPFTGTKNSTFFDATLNGLTLASDTLIDSVTSLIDTIPSIDFLGDIASSGSYEFANILDLGSTMDLRLSRHFVTESFYANDLIDSRTALIDLWTDIDAQTAFDTNAKILVSTTTSDPTATTSATYSQSALTITITKSNHGFSVGSLIDITFTTGSTASANGVYTIVTAADDTFTVTSSSSDTASGNCTLGAEFSAFNTFANGTHRGRAFKFKAELSSSDPAQTILIKELGYTATLERRVETVNSVIASGTSTKAVSFLHPFFTGAANTSVSAGSALPTIGIVIENAQSGDFFSLSSISSTGFSIDIKNGSSFVNRNFKYTAVGFGRQS